MIWWFSIYLIALWEIIQFFRDKSIANACYRIATTILNDYRLFQKTYIGS